MKIISAILLLTVAAKSESCPHFRGANTEVSSNANGSNNPGRQMEPYPWENPCVGEEVFTCPDNPSKILICNRGDDDPQDLCVNARNASRIKDMPRRMGHHHCSNFLFGFALVAGTIMAAAFLLSYLRPRFASAANLTVMLSPTYAQASSLLYNMGNNLLKILMAVLKSVSNVLSSKSNGSGGKSPAKAKEKMTTARFKGLLIILTMIACCPVKGEAALWFSHDNVFLESDVKNESFDAMQSGLEVYQDKDDASTNDFKSTSGSINKVANLRESDTGLQEDVSGSELVSIQNDLSEMLSNIQHLALDSTTSDTDTLKASAKAMSLVKNSISDLQLSLQMPSHLQFILKSTLNELTNAEKNVQKIEGFVSKHHGFGGLGETSMSSTHRRILSSEQASTTEINYNRGVTKTDHYMRAKGHHLGLGNHHGLGNHFGHAQQGYHRARASRQEGGMRRRLEGGDDGSVCIELPSIDQKAEQCFRLADCAQFYGLYDMFVFLFADDLDFNTGAVDDNVKTFDEAELRDKLATVQELSSAILRQYDIDDEGNGILKLDADSILSPLDPSTRGCNSGTNGCICDQLLQEFHRFDEGLSVQGKWAGGSVTGVCRGWGTSKFVSLESIFHIAETALNNDPVDQCVRDEVEKFNRKLGDDTLVNEDPAWCRYGRKGSNNECCSLGGCILEDQCGSTQNFWVESTLGPGLCYDSNDNTQFLNQTTCCGQTSGCCKAGCCKRDISTICQDVDDTKCTIDPNAVEFIVPEDPCTSVVNDIQFQGIWALAFFITVQNSLKSSTKTNIDNTFQCLYYSYFVTEYSCFNLTQPQREECQNACDNVKDPSFIIEASVFGDKNDEGYFNYLFPAILPRQRDIPTFLQLELGVYGLADTSLTVENAATFIVDVFDEFMGCANDLVASLYSKYPDDVQKLFTYNNGANPYASGGDQQFGLPLRINDGGRVVDGHGQILDQSAFLDQVYDYIDVGDSAGIKIVNGTPIFSAGLKSKLIEVYTLGENIEDMIEYYEERVEKEDGPVKDLCNLILVALKDLRATLSNQGLVRSQLDTSISLLFGNKTTIGQVCSYSKALEEGMVDNMTGFCCLDAPYEADAWGETYTCQKYVTDSSLGSVVVQKNANDCNRLGPVTSGYNQAACDIFQGTWCPSPRDCFDLVKCVNDEIVAVEQSRTRLAFLEYLKEAPKVEFTETNDPTKCADLREYFDYDRDYPDDDRICREVRELQCLTDFTNLDGLATGSAGADGGGADVQLAVSDKLVENAEELTDEDKAFTWRTVNYALQKAVGAVKFLYDTLTQSRELCEVIPLVVVLGTGSDAPRTICKAGPIIASQIISVLVYAAELALDISERIYGEQMTPSDAVWETSYQNGRQEAIYKNVITNHGNIITTFQATQQLKVMLGEISDGLEEDREEETRRRLQETCVNTTSADGYKDKGTCNATACEDFTRLCDGSFNFPYIANLRQAGCDELDSDGNGRADDCEDRFPPEILLRNAEIFRCDRDDTSKLCYTGQVFKNETDAKNFLEYQFPASDDCSPSSQLSVDIVKISGSCRDTTYTLTPVQNIPKCDGYIAPPPLNMEFVNPLQGNTKLVTMQLDEEAPVVICGFLGVNPFNMIAGPIAGNTALYHYMLKTDGDGSRLNDARFFYNVTDNCEEDVHIDIVVKSNEIQQNKINIAELFKRKRVGVVEQVDVLYAPTRCGCKNIGFDGLCRPDPSMEGLKTRYYDITVTASDSAGNTGSDTCKVVIVPSCNPGLDSNCGNQIGDTYYYNISVVDSSVTSSAVLYEVAKETLVWESGLKPPDLADDLGEAVDIDTDPPVVNCSLGTQLLRGTGAGVFTDLGFSFTAVDGGGKCTDTKDLAVTIEVLSNEVVATGEEMVIISTPRTTGKSPSIWAEDHTCKSSTNVKCKVSSTKKTREYIVRVTATDEAGNVGVHECNTIVGKIVGKQSVRDTEDPLFLISKLGIVGGVESESVSSDLFL